jgi:hypothetical protein
MAGEGEGEGEEKGGRRGHEGGRKGGSEERREEGRRRGRRGERGGRRGRGVNTCQIMFVLKFNLSVTPFLIYLSTFSLRPCHGEGGGFEPSILGLQVKR